MRIRTVVYIFIMCVAALGMSVSGCSSCNGEHGGADTIVAELVSNPTRLDTIVGMRLDSLMKLPMRLDTTKISVSVFDLTSNTMVYEHRAKQLRVPASCMKVLTAVTALKAMGCDYVYETGLYAKGKMKQDTLRGTLILSADDDPLVLDFEDLADAVRAKGIRCVDGEVVLNLARTDTLKAHPSAAVWDIQYKKLPLLMRGEKYIRQQLIGALVRHGVRVKEGVDDVSSGEAVEIASVKHSLAEVLSQTLIHSSNIKAEAVFYHLDKVLSLSQGNGVDVYSHEMPHRTERLVEEELGISVKDSHLVINDGSGLSPQSRLTTDFFIRLLQYAYRERDIFDILVKQALATPAHPERHGSLMGRMTAPLFRERIFAKTGTIVTIGASSLSGYARADDGHWLAFSIINEDSPVAESHIFQDKVCKELVR